MRKSVIRIPKYALLLQMNNNVIHFPMKPFRKAPRRRLNWAEHLRRCSPTCPSDKSSWRPRPRRSSNRSWSASDSSSPLSKRSRSKRKWRTRIHAEEKHFRWGSKVIYWLCVINAGVTEMITHMGWVSLLLKKYCGGVQKACGMNQKQEFSPSILPYKDVTQ